MYLVVSIQTSDRSKMESSIMGALSLSQAGVLNQDLYYRFNDVEYRYNYCHNSSKDKHGEEKLTFSICPLQRVVLVLF